MQLWRNASCAKRLTISTIHNRGSLTWTRTRPIQRPSNQLKLEGTLRHRCQLRQCKFLNNVIEQDHRFVKQRVWLAKGYGSFRSAWRTLQGIEAVQMIRKGRVRRVPKNDTVGQARFIENLF